MFRIFFIFFYDFCSFWRKEIISDKKEVVGDMFDIIYVSLNNIIYYLWIVYVI